MPLKIRSTGSDFSSIFLPCHLREVTTFVKEYFLVLLSLSLELRETIQEKSIVLCCRWEVLNGELILFVLCASG